MDFLLRELERSDLPAINRWRGDRSVTDQLGAAHRHVGVEVDAQWFEAYLRSRDSNVRLAICEGGTQEPLGVVYLLGIDWVNRCAEFAIQIGAAKRRGAGLGTWATREMLRHGFQDLQLHRIYLTVVEYNQAALRLYRKVGFTEEGRLRQAVFKKGRYVDQIAMGMLASEFHPAADAGASAAAR